MNVQSANRMFYWHEIYTAVLALDRTRTLLPSCSAVHNPVLCYYVQCENFRTSLQSHISVS
jgi:hypothetical protein